MNPRTIHHDQTELLFDHIPMLADLIQSVGKGQAWHWNYQGLVGVLTPEVLSNGLDIYLAYKKQRNRREPIPRHVGRFFWAQTIPLQIADNLPKSGTAGESRPNN